MAGSLDGKTALVTGASRGIGKSSAIALAEAGARVFCVSTSAGGCCHNLLPRGSKPGSTAAYTVRTRGASSFQLPAALVTHGSARLVSGHHGALMATGDVKSLTGTNLSHRRCPAWAFVVGGKGVEGVARDLKEQR